MENCVITENGFYGNQDVDEPVFEEILFHYQLELKDNASLEDTLPRLELAMAQDVITSTSLFTECRQQNRTRSLLSVARILQLLPGKRIEVRPAISSRPPDTPSTKKDCPLNEYSANSKCFIMMGVMTLYYPFGNRAEYEPKVEPITIEIQGVLNSAMDRGAYMQIDGISGLKYVTDDEYDSELPNHIDPVTDETGNIGTALSESANENTDPGENNSYVFPIVAGSITAGTFALFGLMFHVRRVINSKQSSIESRVISESNVV